MTGSRIGAAALLQAPPEIQALDEADVQPETVSGGDIPLGENGLLPPEGRFISPAEAEELDPLSALAGSDFNSLSNMVWDADVTGQLDPGSSWFWTG
jgi:hypothetical protein